MLSPKYTYFEFNYADIVLEGYGGDDSDSSTLLKKIIEKLNSSSFPTSEKTIDRFEKRQGIEKRILVHISAPFEKEGKRVFGKIALIKNKSIYLVNLSGAELIEEIEKPKNKEFVEITNYSITFATKPILMVEFNSSGPRLSDLEYYFRKIAKNQRIAKSLNTSLHLSIDYAKLSQDIDNVFSVIVKVKASNIDKSSSIDWLDGFKKLKDDVGYRDVRLELFYHRIKNENTNEFSKNIKGLKFARNILDWLTKMPENIEKIDDLKMSYQKTGSDEIIDLDFIKNKTTSVVSIHTENVNKRQAFIHEVGLEFNKYLSTGETTKDPKND